MKLLLTNAFKGLRNKKIQMFAIIILIMLSTGIYTAINTALDRAENRYYNYLEEQNVENFSFVPKIDYSKDVSSEDIEKLLLLDLLEQEKKLLNNYQLCLKHKLCDDQIYLGVKSVFEKYGHHLLININKVEDLAKKYNFNYEIESAKVYTKGDIIIKAIPYKSDKEINKMYLIEGDYPLNDNEITILPKFAKVNNLKIGDWYKINNVDYKIVGFSYASDHVYPLISLSSPVFNDEKNNVIFMNEKSYQEFLGVKEEVIAARFNYKYDRKNKISISVGQSNTEQSNKDKDPVADMIEKGLIEFDLVSITRFVRANVIQNDLNSNRVFSETFLYLLLIISILIIVVVIKKRIDSEKLQIGVLKSLGYNTFLISSSYLVYPIVASIVGGILGYIIGLLLNKSFALLLLKYYTIPLSGLQFNASLLLKIILIPLLTLSIISYITALIMLRKKPLYLLKEGSNLKVNFLSRTLNKLVSFLPFDYRFKYSLAFRSLGKLLIVSITSFMTGLLIVLVLIGSNLFNSLISKTFESFKFDYIVNYNTIQFGESDQDDLVFTIDQRLTGIKDEKGNSKEMPDKDFDLNIVGIDYELRYVTVLDETENNLLANLHEDNNIVINKNIQEILNVVINDELIVNINGQDISYKITGIAENYMANIAYVNRANLADAFKLPEDVYNRKYTINPQYSDLEKLNEEEVTTIASIFSIDDLEKNIKDQTSAYNGMIYVIITFASFMALVIIAVIANIVVEENQKTISLMKVLGYPNKKISAIVLNIYTPFVIISYLLSIPAMKNLLIYIVKGITSDIGYAIPIELSPLMATVGLFGLLISYYIAISLSKRIINKTPLAMALKRE